MASRPFIGRPSASRRPLIARSCRGRANHFVPLTHDLDFSAILAAGAEAGPSVVQLRMQDLLSERALAVIVTAVNAHADVIERGALMSIDESGARVRILPFRRP